MENIHKPFYHYSLQVLIIEYSNKNVKVIVKFFVFVIIILIILAHLYLIKKFSINLKISVLTLSLILLNPYLIRYFISIPTLLNDLIFIFACYLFCIGFILSEKITLLGIFLSLLVRQTGIALVIGFLVNKIFFTKQTYKKIYTLILFLILCFIIFFTSEYYATNVSNNFKFLSIYGLFHWIYNDWNFFQFFEFLTLPLLSYIPIIICFFILGCNFSNSESIQKMFILILVFALIIAQPILGGPGFTGRNIIRLTSLGYPIILFLLMKFSLQKNKFKNNYFFYTFILLLHLWSFHPRYSLSGLLLN